MADAAGTAPLFGIRRLYLKDASFEAPRNPLESEGETPNLTVNLRTENEQVEGDFHEVTLTATVEAAGKNGPIFLVEVQQAGLFELKGYKPDHLDEVLGSLCPSQLFPFVRETVCNLVVKGGDPQLQLHPVNFAELYQKRKAGA